MLSGNRTHRVPEKIVAVHSWHGACLSTYSPTSLIPVRMASSITAASSALVESPLKRYIGLIEFAAAIANTSTAPTARYLETPGSFVQPEPAGTPSPMLSLMTTSRPSQPHHWRREFSSPNVHGWDGTTVGASAIFEPETQR